MDGSMIACCGVDCSVCPDLLGGSCPGCRKTEWAGEDICMPVACCREKGISSCGECGGFPCEAMRTFYAESESHEAAYRRMCAVRGGKAL